VQAEGGTLGEAKWNALKTLEASFPGLDGASVRFDVVREPDEEAGVAAVVAGEVDVADWERRSRELPEEPAERVRALMTRICAALGLRATVDIEESDEEIRATVNGEDLGLLIGRHGATIDAVQHLALRAAMRAGEDSRRVVVDAAGYRERREAVLRRAADRAVADALRYGRAVELEPMSAAERKIVHQYLAERSEVETHSEGTEPDRRLVVSPLRR
jgi:spoIIIJ-associated protein